MSTLDRGLPSDGGVRRKPWLLHSLDVKGMNFCGMDMCAVDDVRLTLGGLIEECSCSSFFWILGRIN